MSFRRAQMRGRRGALALLAAIAAATLWPGPAARAQQCATAGTNQTCTNSIFLSGGATGLFDNATVTVTNTDTGTISGGGGILATDANVINFGTITGSVAFGVFANATASVTNFGTITGATDGIVGGTTANVTNSGTITGVSGSGIGANDTANVTNSGTIRGGTIAIAANNTANVTNSSTIVGGASGVFGLTNANVINSGTITGGVDYGIVSSGNANVTNSGTIRGAADGVFGATVDVTNSGTITGGSGRGISAGVANIINSGTITGGSEGIGAITGSVSNSGTITGGTFGIQIGAGSVTNSGTIIGPIAIEFFTGTADTLTLLPGSRIVGAIVLGGAIGGSDTVNFRGGNHNLTFDTLAGATVTGTTPFVVVGNQAVAIDVTPFVVAGTMLGDFSRSVSAVVPMFDNQPAAGGAPMAFAAPGSPSSVVAAAFDHIPGLSAYAADTVAFKAPTVTHADGTIFWARGFGGQRIQQADGVILRNVSNFFGGAMGMDKVVSPNLRIGGFIGAGTTRSSIALNSGDSDSNLGFGGLYARYWMGASFLHAAVQGGGSHNDTTRNINNNLVLGGLETAKASYNGWYVSPELTLGHRIALGHLLGAQHTLTPSIQVRYLYGSFGSYTETGSTANLTVNGQTVQTLEERAELKLTRATFLNPYSTLLVHLTGGALGIQRVGGNSVNAVLLGQAIPFAMPGKDDVWGGYGGLGMEFRHHNVAVFGAAEYLALNDDSSVVSGKAGVRVAF
ncbi:MAG: autotransporter domain-containing protein [Xanthobacteraceae bacterium]|nr:autotransporter domain-containing protein [Xanthobacteraceae bacterium]